jgi:hypothetical protein
MVEIDFLAHDPDGHLGQYMLSSNWGLSDSRELLGRPGVSVTPLGTAPTGWALGQASGNYGTALTQGAVAPSWTGGRYRLTMPVTEAFPEPCCYQLELRAWKRTIIGSKSGHTFTCSGDNRNQTHYSIGVGVCGDDAPPILTANDRLVRG